MKAFRNRELIDVDALRVGMFIHLDLNWTAHPFALGSFRIANPGQVATIRSLGLRSVRWSPEQSDAASAVASDAPVQARPEDEAQAAGDAAEGAAAGASAQAVTPTAPDALPESAGRAAHRRALAAERAALQLCEQQFAQAAQACQQLTGMVALQPVEAREHAELLSKALLDKMLGTGELCIRLLTDAAGDKASVHALNVTLVSLLLARNCGLSEAELLDVGVGAVLHDIGKLYLPQSVRHLGERFSAAEIKLHEEHVMHGLVQAARMRLTPGATQVIAQHHEQADGSGFPQGQNADRMSAASRIVALVNRYDNLCNPHLSRSALTPHEALAALFAQGHSKFDAAVLGSFVRMMGVYPPGSAVQLTDDRYALVVAADASCPLKPVVLVYDARTPADEALAVALDAHPGLGIRRSLKPAQLLPAVRDYLSPRPRVIYFFEPAAERAPRPADRRNAARESGNSAV